MHGGAPCRARWSRGYRGDRGPGPLGGGGGASLIAAKGTGGWGCGGGRGEGRARTGGSRGLPSLPRPTRDLGLRTPRIHLWPQVRGSGCGGRGSRLGFRGAGARRWGPFPRLRERSGGGGLAGRCGSGSLRNAPSPPPSRSQPSAGDRPPPRNVAGVPSPSLRKS